MHRVHQAGKGRALQTEKTINAKAWRIDQQIPSLSIFLFKARMEIYT
jgi:hypothetical protein